MPLMIRTHPQPKASSGFWHAARVKRVIAALSVIVPVAVLGTYFAYASSSNRRGPTPTLPRGLTGTLVSNETGAPLYADSGWSKSYPGSGPHGINPSSGCRGLSGTIAPDGTYLDLTTKSSSSWSCAGIESTTAYSPGHIFQLQEYIPVAANGNIADYPSWWLTDAHWNFEIDAAERALGVPRHLSKDRCALTSITSRARKRPRPTVWR